MQSLNGWWTKLTCTVFHNRASDILRESKQWWTLTSKISRGSGPSNHRRIDAYGVINVDLQAVAVDRAQ